eukprot:3935536-Rhodomonas_salina.1
METSTLGAAKSMAAVNMLKEIVLLNRQGVEISISCGKLSQLLYSKYAWQMNWSRNCRGFWWNERSHPCLSSASSPLLHCAMRVQQLHASACFLEQYCSSSSCISDFLLANAVEYAEPCTSAVMRIVFVSIGGTLCACVLPFVLAYTMLSYTWHVMFAVYMTMCLHCCFATFKADHLVPAIMVTVAVALLIRHDNSDTLLSCLQISCATECVMCDRKHSETSSYQQQMQQQQQQIMWQLHNT